MLFKQFRKGGIREEKNYILTPPSSFIIFYVPGYVFWGPPLLLSGTPGFTGAKGLNGYPGGRGLDGTTGRPGSPGSSGEKGLLDTHTHRNTPTHTQTHTHYSL